VYRFQAGPVPGLSTRQLWNGLLARTYTWKFVGTSEAANQHLRTFEACLQNIRDYELAYNREITQDIIGDWVAVRLCGEMLECLDRHEYEGKVCTIRIRLA
jgi:hypothetical protein